MSDEIMVFDHSQTFLPIMNVDAAISRRATVVKFVQALMVEGTDFGKIPGTNDKPVLLKPGAEKLSTFFGLTPVFVPVEVIEDWTGEQFGGEPMFYYRYRCELHRAGQLIATSEGSCNSRESKYRYRKGERTCPNCEQPAIIRGKEEYGGGWVCFHKKGGCGAKFQLGDKRIEGQEVGRVFNPDIADQVNTIQKMAQKRALVAAILLAVNASEFFTQDVEDLAPEDVVTVDAQPVKPAGKPRPEGTRKPKQATAKQPEPVNPFDGPEPDTVPKEVAAEIDTLGKTVYGDAWATKQTELAEHVSKGSTNKVSQLLRTEADLLLSGLKKRAEAAQAPTETKQAEAA